MTTDEPLDLTIRTMNRVMDEMEDDPRAACGDAEITTKDAGAMKKQLQILIVSALGLFAGPRTADACDCVRGRALPPAQFGSSDVVFRGRVVQSQPLVYVEFEVLETFNGRVDRRVRILTGRSECDYFLPPVVTKSGTEFLVYGTIRDDGILEVNRCLGSGPSNLKTRELETLRQRVRLR